MRLYVIINPGAGQNRPILAPINDRLVAKGVEWAVDVTNKAGDARRFAERAVSEGYDVVAVYGGDGMVMEVASGLQGSGIPMAILPGGTANVMSVDLGIPSDLEEAVALILDETHEIASVDIGQVADHGYFVLRIGFGIEAEMVKGADREAKDWLGAVAYAFAAQKALSVPPSLYRITVDGEIIEREGVTCLICNSGSVGQGTLRLAPDISVTDGILDVVVLQKAQLTTLGQLAYEVVTGQEPSNEALAHWRGREISVEAIPPQSIQLDGEVLDARKLSVSVVPGALKVIVPPGRITGEDPSGMVESSDG